MDRLVVSCLGNWKWGKKSEDPHLVNLDNSDSDGDTKLDGDAKLDDAKLVFVDLDNSDIKSDGDTKSDDAKVVFVDSSV